MDDTACYLAGPIETLAEALQRSDYATAAFACNPLLDPVKNFDQGFETYDYTHDMRKSESVLPGVADWLANHADARFFLYLHLVDTHEPVNLHSQDLARVGVSATPPPGCPDRAASVYRSTLSLGENLTANGTWNPDAVAPPEHQRWLRETYSAAVSTADRNVGAVLDMLEENGLTEKTVVAFTSDHGEELFDHGGIGHDHTLFQELVHVPLMLAGSGIPRGIRVGTPVSNQHVAWTLARRSGATLAAVTDGIDLAAPDRVERRKLYFSTEHGWWWNDHRTTMQGVEDWPWVLHFIPRGLPFGVPRDTDPGEGLIRLYNLETDPGEHADLSGARADVASALKQTLKEFTLASAARRPKVVLGAGEGTRNMLRRFGYAGDDPKDDHR